LYPRLHLLPNGHVFYNAGGQAFNPFGQGYDQALWNITASYNPSTQRWTDIGYAGLPLRLDEVGLGQLSSTLNVSNISLSQATTFLGDLVSAPSTLVENGLDIGVSDEQLQIAVAGGMRGSTSSTMLPLKPNANGEYTDVELLTAGGVPSYGVLTNPGGYLPTAQSRIDLISTNGDQIEYESRLTGPLNQPRWYGTNVLMPDGSRKEHLGYEVYRQTESGVGIGYLFDLGGAGPPPAAAKLIYESPTSVRRNEVPFVLNGIPLP
jgi:hypothetical protein